jgi:hypothetical protein
VSGVWTGSAPHDRLASECLAALNGNSDPDAYLVNLVRLAWDGVSEIDSLRSRADLAVGFSEASLEAPILAADSAGMITVGLPRLRQVCRQSLELAKQYLMRYRQMCFMPQAPLSDVTELSGFETMVLTLVGASARESTGRRR